MRTVLVVESNEQVVEGFRRLLRLYAHEWTLRFAPGPDEALEVVNGGEAGVVIADARVPGLEAFLLELKTHTPRVIRVVLAGSEVKPEAVLHLTVLAHQVLKKPFIPPQLFDLVERTCQVGEALASERLQLVLGQLGALPPLPSTYSRLSELAQDPDASLDAMASVVERDPAVSGAVLRIINSAYFGLPRRVSSVRETVRYLGVQPLKNIVLTVEVFEGLATGKGARALQEEALCRALAMREVLGHGPLADAAFAAGILADLGLLLITTRLPIDAAALQKAADQGQLPWVAEQARLGCTHAELGAAILARWNLPPALVEAVALHHQPAANASGATVTNALALVTALEYGPRCPEPVRTQLQKAVEALAPAFPGLNLDAVRRHLGRGQQAAG